jgi:hypothetical protein
MQKKHQDLFVKFTETFKPETVQTWENSVKAWEANENMPNPYKEPVNSRSSAISVYYIANHDLSVMTVQDIQLQLTHEEEAEASHGILPPHKLSLSGFLATGLELEKYQYMIS